MNVDCFSVVGSPAGRGSVAAKAGCSSGRGAARESSLGRRLAERRSGVGWSDGSTRPENGTLGVSVLFAGTSDAGELAAAFGGADASACRRARTKSQQVG